MATIRNYNAWIKAARKAAAKTGGLSLPAARKSYRKMAARVDRPLRGTDVKKHPRIFRESIPLRSGGSKPRAKAIRRKVPEKPAGPSPPKRRGKIESFEDYEKLIDELLDLEEIEYATTAEYPKKS